MVTTTNTHLLVSEFDLLEPRTVEEAVAALAEHGEHARPMAGGTDLLVQMKVERRQPTHIVSLARVEGLDRIELGDGMTLGATATVRATWAHPEVRRRYPVLGDACRAFSTVQTMVMGTLGGNLCNASPAADMAPALLVLDARVRLRGVTGVRELPLDAFITGPGQTALATGELLESILLPEPETPSGSAFVKIGRVAADISKVCAAVAVVRDGESVRDCRVAVGAVAPTPLRLQRVEAVLRGGPLTQARIEAAVALVRDEVAPITDVRSTAGYRRHVAGVAVGDALRLAWARSGGGELA